MRRDAWGEAPSYDSRAPMGRSGAGLVAGCNFLGGSHVDATRQDHGSCPRRTCARSPNGLVAVRSPPAPRPSTSLCPRRPRRSRARDRPQPLPRRPCRSSRRSRRGRDPRRARSPFRARPGRLLDGHRRDRRQRRAGHHGEVRINAGAQGRTRFGLPVDLPTGSRKSLELYAQPPAFGQFIDVSLVTAAGTAATARVTFSAPDTTQLVVGVLAEKPAPVVAAMRLPASISRHPPWSSG